MKKILYILLLLSFNARTQSLLRIGTDWPSKPNQIIPEVAQKNSQVLSCAANTILTTGYPVWTNYYAGFMFMINNTSTCSIIINCFEARFQGTSGCRIYTKTGTFIGFEILSGSWTLVGTAVNVVGISTTTCSPIPIFVGVTIPPSSSQSFYLTRTDNTIANRHLYITGNGTAGTTIYASDANIQVTEAEYLDTYFGLQAGTRRPSFDVYYDKICSILPVEMINFEGKNYENFNSLSWITMSELNNKYFEIERSEDGYVWSVAGQIVGSGTSHSKNSYQFKDYSYNKVVNYYRLKQIDYDGNSKVYYTIAINNLKEPLKITKYINLLGEEVSSSYEGIYIIIYEDGTYAKRWRN